MDFAGLVYSDFVNLNQNDALMTLGNNFTTTFTVVDNLNFKLKLTPNLGIYFTDVLFCALTKA
jgi:hypothetical protein